MEPRGSLPLVSRDISRVVWPHIFPRTGLTANRHRQSNSLFHQKFLKFKAEIPQYRSTVPVGTGTYGTGRNIECRDVVNLGGTYGT